MSYVYSFRVVDDSSTRYFRYENTMKSIFCSLIPGCFFVGGTLVVWRAGEVFATCDNIQPYPEGTAHLVAFNPLSRPLGGLGSYNLRVKWTLEAYTLIPDDLLVFKVKRQVRLVDEIIRLQLYLEFMGNRYTPGSQPSQEFYSDCVNSRIERLSRQSSFVLRIPDKAVPTE